MHNWNVDDDYWEYNGYTISGAYKGVKFKTVNPTTFRLGIQRMTFGALPEGTITAATLHGQTWRYNGTSNDTVYYQASDDADEWHDTTPSDPISKYLSFSTTRTDYTLDVKDQLNDYGTSGAALYLYAYLSAEIGTQEHVWNSGGTLPYIEITYTPNSAIGLYDSATSQFTDRIIKKYNGTSWVDCNCYKYNSTTSTWEKVSTT